MNSQIIVLDQKTINLIAAGEVIERPASIIKELVENSLDAGSSSITIEVHGSGQPLIRISDNGHGMTADEVSLALKRHATSKISGAQDLFNIRTFGFRGEALPSVASVSKIQIISKKKDEMLSGVELCAEGGKVVSIQEKGVSSGTIVTVKDVFYNLPARRKYLKKEITEFSHIYSFIEKFIISKSDVKFKLLHNGKEIISSLGNGDLLDVLVTVFGRQIKEDILPFKLKKGLISINGYIGQPQLTYPNKSKEMIFVNGRFVYAPLLTRTLEEGYKGLIPSGRFPFGVIFVDVDPQYIDVNVHPTKREVRFEKVSQVLNVLRDAVKSTLNRNKQEIELTEEYSFQGSCVLAQTQSRRMEQIYRDEELRPVFESIQEERISQPLFQYKDTYLVTVFNDDLVIIDQHVAHERILYDKLAKTNSKEAKSQQLLLPLNLEVSPLEKKIILDIIPEIVGLGYILEEFGQNSFIIRGVPSDIYEQDHIALIKDLIEEFRDFIGRKNVEEIREKVLVTISCRAAIKAGRKLNMEEMGELMSDLKKAEHPQTCPHGRPIIFKFSQESLQKMFKRR